MADNEMPTLAEDSIDPIFTIFELRAEIGKLKAEVACCQEVLATAIHAAEDKLEDLGTENAALRQALRDAEHSMLTIAGLRAEIKALHAKMRTTLGEWETIWREVHDVRAENAALRQALWDAEHSLAVLGYFGTMEGYRGNLADAREYARYKAIDARATLEKFNAI